MKYQVFQLVGTIESPPLPNRTLMNIQLGNVKEAMQAFVYKSEVVDYVSAGEVEANSLEELRISFNEIANKVLFKRELFPGDIVTDSNNINHIFTWQGWLTQ